MLLINLTSPIDTYDRSVVDTQSVAPFHMALNLLGDTKAGKSSFLASLKNGLKAVRVNIEDRTVGAELHIFPVEGGIFYIYDFGGHESYVYFHQIYLTPLAINAVFVDCSESFDLLRCQGQLKRWIHLIVAKVPDAMFLIVMSKNDISTGFSYMM